MKDYIDLKTIMEKRGISIEDQEVIKDFLAHFSFSKRQQLMGVLIGFPEELPVFIDILKKKKLLAKSFDASQAQELLAVEQKKIGDIMKQI